MTTQTLEDIFQLNNTGAYLLCSVDPRDTEAALKCFKKAVAIATASSIQNQFASKSTYQESNDTGVSELCMFSPAPITLAGEDSFYFFDQVLYLRPDIFVGPMEQSVPKTMEFFMAVTLLNSALALFRVAHDSLAYKQHQEANELFYKSLHLYAKAVALFTKSNSNIGRNSRAMLFFVLAARNNYLLLCSRLGFHTEARLAHAAMQSIADKAGTLLPLDTSRVVDEIILNTALLRMTDFFFNLPASAA